MEAYKTAANETYFYSRNTLTVRSELHSGLWICMYGYGLVALHHIEVYAFFKYVADRPARMSDLSVSSFFL
jgi:hypothetical protein